MRPVIRIHWSILILSFTILGCQPKEKDLMDWLHELPEEHTLIASAALDSLITFGEYLDPKGDSLEQTKFELRLEENTAEIQLGFTTGQRGFNIQQFKLLDSKHLMTCSYSGSPWNSSISRLKLFEIKDDVLQKIENPVLSNIINNTEHLVLTQKEKLNGVTGCDFFTKPSNTLKVYYKAGIDDEELKDKDLILKWTGSTFRVTEN